MKKMVIHASFYLLKCMDDKTKVNNYIKFYWYGQFMIYFTD